MEKKVCLITGANSGIGFELAKGMAQRNFQTVMLCRNQQKGEFAKENIIEFTKNPNVDLMIADLASQKSIRKFVANFNAKYEHLDVLFNNAGANFFNRKISPDNIEMTFAVNFLATFLMTNLLLPKLGESHSARIITTVGDYSRKSVINFDDINLESNYSVTTASNQAILAKFLFTLELSRTLMNTNITSNCFHPGAVRTNLQKKMPFLLRILVGIMRPFFLSAKKGAEAGLYLATSKDLENVNGKYFKRFKEVPFSQISTDYNLAKNLLKLSEDMTELRN
jgi:NAD(P)-dependent dehydrogenase (short-subunit alcohol dehydrogenase family)